MPPHTTPKVGARRDWDLIPGVRTVATKVEALSIINWTVKDSSLPTGQAHRFAGDGRTVHALVPKTRRTYVWLILPRSISARNAWRLHMGIRVAAKQRSSRNPPSKEVRAKKRARNGKAKVADVDKAQKPNRVGPEAAAFDVLE